MENNKTKSEPVSNPHWQDRIFIPDLCSVHAVFALVIFSELLVVTLILMKQGWWQFDWLGFSQVSFFVVWVTLPSAAIICPFRKHWVDLPTYQVITYAMSLILLVMTTVSWIAVELGFIDTIQPLYWWLNNLVITFLISLLLLHYFYLQWLAEQKSKASLESQVQALQARIKPHFLFNAMNSLAALVHIDVKKSEEVIEGLSKLFRFSLQQKQALISLSEEIELCKQYINIEQVRLGNKLSAKWQINNSLDLNLIQVPPLSIQPLIENAIVHGVQESIQGGEIEIVINEISVNDCPAISIQISNPLVLEQFYGESDSAQTSRADENKSNQLGGPETNKALRDKEYQGNQMAIPNIRFRLQALFPEVGNLKTEQIENRFCATMWIPK